MIEWISTKDRVPDNDDEVLIWGSSYTMTGYWWPYEDNRMGDKKDTWRCYYDGFSRVVVGVTHWAEITPPNIDKE